MSAIHLRAMQWPDITEVHAIETSVFAVDHWSVEQFWSELAQPTRHYVVAVDDGVIVGYAGCFVLPPDADVQTIAVSPAATGRSRLAPSSRLRFGKAGGRPLLLRGHPNSLCLKAGGILGAQNPAAVLIGAGNPATPLSGSRLIVVDGSILHEQVGHAKIQRGILGRFPLCTE